MTAGPKASNKKAVEVVAVLGVYLLFMAVGAYSGQTTMNVDITSPTEGTRFRSSPVELVTRVTVRGVPLPDVKAKFTIYSSGTDEMNFPIVTDTEGVAKLVFPAWSGNYTWHIAASKEGYPTILSRSRSFSVTLSLIVDGLLPSHRFLAVSPVDFKARVEDLKGRPVESASVTFYVDSIVVGSNVTDTNGIARLSSPVASGQHEWFASANKDGEGGLSQTTLFVVWPLESLATDQSDTLMSVVSQLGERSPSNTHRSHPAYHPATMMSSSSALNE